MLGESCRESQEPMRPPPVLVTATRLGSGGHTPSGQRLCGSSGPDTGLAGVLHVHEQRLEVGSELRAAHLDAAGHAQEGAASIPAIRLSASSGLCNAQ